MTAPSPSGAAAGLLLVGVTMELAGIRGPATVVAGVTLALGPEGLTVTPPSGPPSVVPWSSIGWARCGEGGILADGERAVAVAATVDGRLVRWLVPEEQLPPARAMAVDLLLTTRTAPSDASGESGEPGPGGGMASGRGGVGATGQRLPVPGTSGAGRAVFPASPARPTSAMAASGPSLGVALAWLAIATLVLVGAGLVVASSIHVPQHARRGGQPAHAHGVAEARSLARAVSLRVADLPSGWTAVSTPAGPLSGFLDGGARTTSSSGAAQAAGAFARCLGVRAAAVPLVAAGPAPLARSTSGAFAGPATGPPMQVASITTVYATSAPVRRAVGQLERPRFASCFGAAVGQELARSVASQAPTGVTTGMASVQALPLPRWAGIRATGVDLKLPLDIRGEATSVQLGFLFVTGARVEATVVSFSTTGVPPRVSQALAATLEEEVAAAGAA